MAEINRFHHWVSLSFVTAKFESFMPMTIQSLGRLDHDLVAADVRFLALSEDQRSESLALNYQITLSYLWVLGAYEIVRTIAQRCKEHNVHPEILQRVTTLKREFERLRIPLAKYEPSNRHRDTDSKVAYPAFNLDYGVAWQVAADTFIPRKLLADDLLAFLEHLRVSNGNA